MKNIKLSELLNHTEMYTNVQIVNNAKDTPVMIGTVAKCLFNYQCEVWCVETINIQNETMIIEVVQCDENKK